MSSLVKTANQFAASLSVDRQRLIPWNKPTHVFLEVTNRCNLSCVMCGRTHDRRYKDDSFVGDISLETVRKLDSFYGASTFVTATGLGEPFLNPQMIPILKYLKGKKAVVSLTTNGTILTKEIAEALVESETDRVVCSVDSPDAATFERIRVGARFREVIDNLRLLSSARSQLRHRKPYLILEFVAMAQNFHQLPDVADLANDLGFDEVIVQNLFKAFDPGYNAFYQKNKLSALHPEEALRLWEDFYGRLRKNGLRLYSPFGDGGIHRYLRKETDSPAGALKSSQGFVGYIDKPLPRAHVESRCEVAGWALGKQGRPEVDVCLESATQTILHRLTLNVPRPDVLPHLPQDFPQESLCGFSETIDLSDVDSGVWTISLRVRHDSSEPSRTLARHQLLVRTREDYRMYCTQPWSTLYVTWDGQIRTCCFNEYVLGNLSSDPIEAIWNGANYQKLRNQVVNGEVIPECMDCVAGKSNPNYVRELKSWLSVPRRLRRQPL